MKPYGDNILIEPDEAQAKTKSGLLLHQNWKNLPPYGTVIAIGDDVTNIDVGDRVVFNRYAAINAPLEDGKNYKFIKQKHIMAVFDAPDS